MSNPFVSIKIWNKAVLVNTDLGLYSWLFWGFPLLCFVFPRECVNVTALSSTSVNRCFPLACGLTGGDIQWHFIFVLKILIYFTQCNIGWTTQITQEISVHRMYINCKESIPLDFSKRTDY